MTPPVKKTRAQQHAAFLHQARKRYDELLAAQDGVCGLCGRAPKDGERFHIDHAHGAAKLSVRGILCPFCNRRLRSFMRPDWLRQAAAYLERAAA